MSQNIDKFIKFLSDLDRGCHIEDLNDAYVYCLHDDELMYVESHEYSSTFQEAWDSCCWNLDVSGIDHVMWCIISHSLKVIYDPGHQPKQVSRIRKVEL